MRPVKHQITTRALPSPSYNGKLEFVGGFSGGGKSASVLAELRCEHEPFLWVCTDVSNPGVKKLPWVDDSEEGLAYVLANPLKTMAVRCYKGNPDILKVCRDRRRAVCLDEIANLFHTGPMMGDLLMYAREVRYIDGGLQVWATTQRSACDVRPGIYFAARRIKWVGQMGQDPAALKALYRHHTGKLTKDQFKEVVDNLVPYNWAAPNLSESVILVKDI